MLKIHLRAVLISLTLQSSSGHQQSTNGRSFLISGEKLQGSVTQCNSEDTVCKFQIISSEVQKNPKTQKSSELALVLHCESVLEQRVQFGALKRKSREAGVTRKFKMVQLYLDLRPGETFTDEL